MIYTLKSGAYEAKIASLGAELVSLKKDGRESIWYGTAPYWTSHAPILFPICGKLLNDSYCYKGKRYAMKGHGFAGKCEFTLVKSTDTELILSLKENDSTLECYPFPFELICSYELSDEGFSASYTVKNTGDSVMPYMFGWHPGFNLIPDGGADINDYYVDFENLESLTMYPLIEGTHFTSKKAEKYPLSSGKFLINEDYIYPRDTIIFYHHNNKCVLASDKNSYKVTFAWSENLPKLALWKRNDSRAKYFCLEPWTGVSSDGSQEENFETREMERLDAGCEKTYSYKVQIEF